MIKLIKLDPTTFAFKVGGDMYGFIQTDYTVTLRDAIYRGTKLLHPEDARQPIEFYIVADTSSEGLLQRYQAKNPITTLYADKNKQHTLESYARYAKLWIRKALLNMLSAEEDKVYKANQYIFALKLIIKESQNE